MQSDNVGVLDTQLENMRFMHDLMPHILSSSSFSHAFCSVFLARIFVGTAFNGGKLSPARNIKLRLEIEIYSISLKLLNIKMGGSREQNSNNKMW